MLLRIFLFASIFFSFTMPGPVDYPKDYFTYPLDTPMVLAGTFGEIRPDHFHSGLDISTSEREGLPVKAAANGYVSRIKISADGFGKALYITHPNGYVTVYAHLQRFADTINNWVRKKQYEKQSFEIELFPKSHDFIVRKSQIIAFSGSSGSAEGPHLHFEIRDQKSEEPVNPLLFGLKIKDHIPPKLKHLRIFPVPGAGILNTTDTAITFNVKMNNGISELKNSDTIRVFGQIGFGFEFDDRQDRSASRFGIYSAELFVDQKRVYNWKLDRFNFKDTRYVNAHLDYLSQKRDQVSIERCFLLPGNHLHIYGDSIKSGILNFTDDSVHIIRFIIRDFSLNQSELRFSLISSPALASSAYQQSPAGSVPITPDQGFSIHQDQLKIDIPRGAVYKDYYFRYLSGPDKDAKFLSPVFTIGDPFEALQIPITVGIKPGIPVSDRDKSKALIVLLEKNGKPVSCGGSWSAGYLQAKSRRFGDFTMMLDTLAPSVGKISFPGDPDSKTEGIIRLSLKDDLSGIQSYSGKIDGHWFLFEYDPKSFSLTADIGSIASQKQHTLEFTAKDERGNTTRWTSEFFY